MWKLFMLIDRLNRDERGATIVEYGVALLIIVTVGTGALVTLAGDVNTQFGLAEGLL